MKKLIVLLSILVAGCTSTAKYASNHENLMSKTLKPENDKALIYFFRPGVSFGPNVAHAMPIDVAGEHIGNIWQEQYLYYYAYPHTLILKSQDGGAGQYNISAGEIYYFMFDYETFKNNPYWRQISQEEGSKYLRKYKLTGDFSKIVFEHNKPSKALTPTENNRLQAVNKVKNILGDSSYINYNNKDRTGVLAYKVGMHERKKVFSMIESICNTKNVAIKSGLENNGNGSVYMTLDEKYTDKKYIIKFECLY